MKTTLSLASDPCAASVCRQRRMRLEKCRMEQQTSFEKAHAMVEHIFRALLPEHGLMIREAQIMLCHEMLDTLFEGKIALCDAGVGIGKTHAYLAACLLW